MVLRSVWSNVVFVSHLKGALARSSEDEGVSPDAQIDVMPNANFDELQRQEFLSGFYNFRYRVEVYSRREQPDAQLVQLIKVVREDMWSKGYSAVAACDFEEQLPHKGGYKS
jgi:hypothetical protein